MLAAKPAKHGEIWTEPLALRRVSPKFFERLANILNEAFLLDRSDPDVKVASYLCGKEKYVLLSNDRHTYCLAKVRCGEAVAAAESLMKDRGYTVKCEGNSFVVRIPPRGAELVKITQKESD